jgi:hypothetical protein
MLLIVLEQAKILVGERLNVIRQRAIGPPEVFALPVFHGRLLYAA